MKRLIHLSDLHFGRARPELRDPLSEAVRAAAPDMVVVSGDLTQRARREQFEMARAFLDGLGVPWLAVPGNHDIPLWNIFERLIAPFRKYRRHVAEDLEPVHETDNIAIFGANTVDPYRHQRGRLRRSSLRNVCTLFEDPPDDRINVLVAHHPLEQDPESEKSLIPGAKRRVEALAQCGAHLVLTGHLHLWHAGPFLTNANAPGPVQIHSGTSLSNRLRGEVNDFAILDFERDRVVVTRMVVSDDGVTFDARPPLHFARRADGLIAVPDE